MQKNRKCRVCKSKLFIEPLLIYDNMPKAAQYLPTKKSLKHEKGERLKVFQCSGCGLVQLNNKPVGYYREVIRAAGISHEMQSFRKKQFKGFVNKYSLKNKKILEIGCGRGEYLSIMQQAGADAYGLEYGKESVIECKKKGLKVNKGYIENRKIRLSSAPFDAFFTLNFLEHMPNINEVLFGVRNNMIEGGVGLVEVPNFDMILKEKLFSEFIGDHLFYFTKDTLCSTLNINGYEVINCSVIWHNYIISAVVRKRAKLDLKVFNAQQAKIKNELNNFVGKFKSVAIWGAGHQALAVMALSKLEGKIKYVVDSADFKQGKYTPATHIPIVSPNRLASDPVDAIIIMAAGYSDEVISLVRNNHDKKMKIAVLRESELEVV